MPLLHSDEQFNRTRPSAAELLAYTLSDLFPDAVLVGGGQTNIGFYYDFIFTQPFDDQILDLLETRLRTLIKENLEVRTLSMMRENAYDFLLHHHQPILAERALQETSNVISVFQLGKFYSLSTEFQVTMTSEVGSVKLLSGNFVRRVLAEGEATEVLRIEGTAFPDPMTLKQFLKAYEKHKKFDHRLLGPELKIFNFIEQIGSIEPIWYAKGLKLHRFLENIWHSECEKYQISNVSTPLVVNEILLKNQIESFPPFSVEENPYCLSSTRISQHILLYLSQELDFSVLPYRLGEIGKVYQEMNEIELCGLLKNYACTEDLITVFCTEQQLDQELIYSLQFIEQIVTIFDFEVQWVLVTSEHKNVKGWHERNAIERLKEVLSRFKITYLSEGSNSISPPRIEVRWIDSLGREWGGPSVEIMGIAKEYLTDLESGKKVPLVLARRGFGSLERFIALLIEKWKGSFPLWMAPEQVRILSVGEPGKALAQSVYDRCIQEGYRVTLDSREEKLGVKVHAAEKEKVPYLVIVGDREAQQERVSVRAIQERNQNYLLGLNELMDKLHEALIKSKDMKINNS
ncbi:MAG: hypothetical protein H0W88_11225 [Parachlamydiaceae bacterium]|nr:hypothetical protein [Parachlamydiaceae bacterium]